MQCHTERRQTHLTSLRGAKWNYAVYFKVTHTRNIEIRGERLHYHLALLSSMCSGISGTSFTGRIPFVKNQKIRQHYTTLEPFRKTKYKLVGWCFKSNFDEHYQTRWCLNTMDKTKYCDILMSDTQTQLLFRNNSKSVHSQNTNITNKTIQNVTAANNLTNIHCQTVWTQYTGRNNSITSTCEMHSHIGAQTCWCSFECSGSEADHTMFDVLVHDIIYESLWDWSCCKGMK